MRRMTFGLAIVLVSCTVRTTSNEQRTSPSRLHIGSCIQKDSTNNSTFCFERSHSTQFDSTMCDAAQGTWVSHACDRSLYQRICNQETVETIDDGEPRTVLYTYYFKDDSNFFCLGNEVTIEPASNSVEQESTPPEDQEAPAPLMTVGQSLYSEKGCVTCHGDIAASTLRGFSAESIIRAYNAAQHSNVIWPSAEDALAIRDALALSRSEWITLGQTRYAASCQSCHQPIGQSTIIDQTLAGITRARGLMVHQNVSWPNEKDSRALEIAMQEK